MYEVFLILPVHWRHNGIRCQLFLSRIATLPMPPFPGLAISKGEEEFSLETVAYDEDEQEISAVAQDLYLTDAPPEGFLNHVNELLKRGWEVFQDRNPEAHPPFIKEA